MRIAVVNWTSRAAGGIETYVASVVNALDRKGASTALVCETSGPSDRPHLKFPRATPILNVEELGLESVIAELRRWSPDLIFAHGSLSSELEQACLKLAPSIYFVHNYYGTCISGLKTTCLPVIQPCERTFGPACLALYLPRRCGGMNPLTMVRLYRKESAKLDRLRHYTRIVTHSEHMRNEYLRHGFSEELVTAFDFAAFDEQPIVLPRPEFGSSEYRLVSVGRMDPLKGGHVLIDALPRIQRALGKRIVLNFAGDGPSRAVWERSARAMCAKYQGLSVKFEGWIGSSRMTELYQEADLLVLPSLWPEPFGKVGPEAGRYGVPAVAFRVGGIPAWLEHGVNGILASPDRNRAEALAQAAISALESKSNWKRLRAGAIERSARFQVSHHTDRLLSLMEQVVGRPMNVESN